MYILGLNAFQADSSAVLLRDGELVVAVEEERFRRVKHWAGFPSQAITKCLEVAQIDGSAIDHVAVSGNPRSNLLRKAVFAARNRITVANVARRTRNLRKVKGIADQLAWALGVRTAQLPRVHFVEHHRAHLASAFLVSPFADAAVCAIDGFGDFVSTSTAIGRGSHIQMLDRVTYPHSLGVFYTAVTQYLGFPNYGDEFKVMGLAPYGSPNHVAALRRLVTLKSGGKFELNKKFFRHWSEGAAIEWEDGAPEVGTLYTEELERLLGPAREHGVPLSREHEDIACSLQAVYEESVWHVLDALWDRTKNPRLCLAGGCAMNSVANGKIREMTRFHDVYIQPAAGDSGTALGAAYHVWNQVLGRSRRFVMDHGYWGTEHHGVGAATAIIAREDHEWRYVAATYSDEEWLCDDAAQLIAEGNVVGWYQGRMEWGSRALGNRSILADPRRSDMREVISLRIKMRDKFRPFAPSILEEALDDYFVDAAPDPFMQQAYPIREDKRAQIPAVSHVDGSGRLQTVSAETNPRYHALIRAFERLTGVPVLLNTSFNENEPIVDTPEQAVDCFLRTRMDAIVLNEMIIRRIPISAELQGV